MYFRLLNFFIANKLTKKETKNTERGPEIDSLTKAKLTQKVIQQSALKAYSSYILQCPFSDGHSIFMLLALPHLIAN